MGIAQSIVRHSVDLLPDWARSRVRDVPLVRPVHRWLINTFIGRAPFDYTLTAGPAKGVRFRIEMPQDKLIWTGTYESSFARELSRHVEHGAVCYDVGGFRGYMTGVMAAAGAAKVVVFEPNPENFTALQTLSQLNPAFPISVVPFCLADTDGAAEFELLTDRSMGRLANVALQVDQAILERREVQLRRIDSLVSQGELPPPDVMKIDVEGAELEVLSGGSNTIAKRRPVILLEAHSSELAAGCTSFLEGKGYRVQSLDAEDQAAAVTTHLLGVPRSNA